MRDTFNWDEDDIDWNDDFELQKYAHRNLIRNNPRDHYHNELTEITRHIRHDLKTKRINVFVNNYLQIIISSNLNCVETMFSVSSIFEHINELAKKYLSDFNVCNFEIVMEKDNPTIYCSYERV